jgi:YesN/AraC family two-component response regulator
LSKTVNTCFGQNFNDFINGYRVKAVKESFLRGEQIQTSLEGIGYRNGFNSKATFFRAFKKHTGKTPAEFLQSLLKTDE